MTNDRGWREGEFGAMRRRRGKRGENAGFGLTGVRAFARVNTRYSPDPDTSGQVSRNSRRVGTCGFGFGHTPCEGEGQMGNNGDGNELPPRSRGKEQ